MPEGRHYFCTAAQLIHSSHSSLSHKTRHSRLITALQPIRASTCPFSPPSSPSHAPADSQRRYEEPRPSIATIRGQPCVGRVLGPEGFLWFWL
jgi:hypothetical protein